MKHFDITRWLDYLRGFVPSLESAAMEEHLSAGCARCRRIVHLLQAVETVTARDREYRVPAESVRVAKAAFALSDSHPRADSPFAVMARLVFDSFAAPLLAGVRAGRGAEGEQRRMLFEDRDYCLDVSLEKAWGSAEVTLVGQVTSRQSPGQPLPALTVELTSTDGRVASTASDSLGEFCLDYLPRPNMQLHVGLNERRCMVVALSGLEPAGGPKDPKEKGEQAAEDRSAG